MMLKIITLFLLGMAVLAMFGRLRMPKLTQKKKPPLQGRTSCPRCGRFIIGKGPCDCDLPPDNEA